MEAYLDKEVEVELVLQENEYRDKNNVLHFKVPQEYMLPINSTEDDSVTYMLITALKDTPVLQFYHSFRRWLKSLGVPVVQYCYEANLTEVLQCVKFPEQR